MNKAGEKAPGLFISATWTWRRVHFEPVLDSEPSEGPSERPANIQRLAASHVDD